MGSLPENEKKNVWSCQLTFVCFIFAGPELSYGI